MLEYKKGDKVFAVWSSYGNEDIAIETIERTTKTLIVLKNGIKYKKYKQRDELDCIAQVMDSSRSYNGVSRILYDINNKDIIDRHIEYKMLAIKDNLIKKINGAIQALDYDKLLSIAKIINNFELEKGK